ncbi:SgcJ/EcaC family oxidoreductase [Variovorax sp. EL159]|uniref:YybH family protein n=1 Tax=Variovorax sp. EL159 TaxID=1566270 RepID=UPI00088F8549|nr:SgcJ/EcaC family oxidoreductase [Variovorax sp. EL159]SCX72535.1 conserved hypothetical protein [Variovorax sp. EL159]
MSQTINQALETTQRSWNAAASEWDADALAALYTEDAVLFGGLPGQSIGREAVRGYFGSYTGVLASTSLTLFDQVLMELGPELYFAQGYCRFEFMHVSGKRSSTVMRTTWVLVQHDGNWRIRLHHFSTTPERPPID